MTQLKIDVWSDVVCPFCYLGKRKLEKAIQKLNLGSKVMVEWRSFQLDPTFPKNTGVPATKHLADRKGIPLANIRNAQNRLVEQGKDYGIDFQFERAINFNTQPVHRVLHWAKAFGKGDALKTELFRAHFSDGADLSNPENVCEVAVGVGLDRTKTLEILKSDQYVAEFQQDIDLARQIQISGVPFFVFNMKTALSGAQPDDVFMEMIRKAIE